MPDEKDDMTPPPQDMAALRGRDSIPAPIQEALDQVVAKVAELTDGMARVWELRDVAPRDLERKISTLDSLVRETTRYMERVDQLQHVIGHLGKTLQETLASLGKLTTRMDIFYENEWPRAQQQLDGLERRTNLMQGSSDKADGSLVHKLTLVDSRASTTEQVLAQLRTDIDVLKDTVASTAKAQHDTALVAQSRWRLIATTATVVAFLTGVALKVIDWLK